MRVQFWLLSLALMKQMLHETNENMKQMTKYAATCCTQHRAITRP